MNIILDRLFKWLKGRDERRERAQYERWVRTCGGYPGPREPIGKLPQVPSGPAPGALPHPTKRY